MTTKMTMEELLDAEGIRLGPSGWVTVDQETIDAFADTTGDHQWIHIDPERAKGSPFGGTIAHGLLTLSLLPRLLHQLFEVTNPSMAVNYGFNRVRFPAPVPSGSRMRATGEITEVTDLGDAVQSVVTVTMEVDGVDRPGCVAESVVRYIR